MEKKPQEIMAALRNSLTPVKVFKRFRLAGESWAVTESLWPMDSHCVTHIKTGSGVGVGAESVDGAIEKFKAKIKEAGLASMRKGIARSLRERKYLDRKEKIRAKALAKLTYWEKRSLDIEV